MKFTPRPGILDIDPYIPGASKGGAARAIKLSANENPLGPSPLAMQAYKDMADKIHFYPDGASLELRKGIAKKHGLDVDRIVCGNGSDELIAVLCKAYCGEGDEVIYTQYGFLMYPIAALAASATPVKAPEPERGTDLAEILKVITPRTKMIFLANPSNPTGATVNRQELADFHAQVPASVILVLDSAYAEYVEDKFYSDGKELVDRFDNVVMLRTFSKIYGLGGMRVGWSYSSLEIADILNRVRGHFNISNAAQAAALAALDDTAHIEKSFRINAEQKKWIGERLSELGVTVYPSEANFIMLSLETAEKASACLAFLKERGILLRGMNPYDLSDCLRMTIGNPEDMQEVYKEIKEFILTGGA